MNHNFRVGLGYDVHKLVEDRKLILGGVVIPHDLGLEGHSDADVLLHAISDALLGSVALGDIGKHFPDTDKEYENADSRELLIHVNNLIQQEGYQIVNLDATVVAERPKLAPFINQMRTNIANDLKVEREQVSVKATTSEGLGYVGREEGISAQAIVFVRKSDNA